MRRFLVFPLITIEVGFGEESNIILYSGLFEDLKKTVDVEPLNIMADLRGGRVRKIDLEF